MSPATNPGPPSSASAADACCWAERTYLDMAFAAGDVLLLGRESAGVPEAVHQAADARLRIPMRAGQRSINVALAASMVLGEALRQTGGFPG